MLFLQIHWFILDHNKPQCVSFRSQSDNTHKSTSTSQQFSRSSPSYSNILIVAFVIVVVGFFHSHSIYLSHSNCVQQPHRTTLDQSSDQSNHLSSFHSSCVPIATLPAELFLNKTTLILLYFPTSSNKQRPSSSSQWSQQQRHHLRAQLVSKSKS